MAQPTSPTDRLPQYFKSSSSPNDSCTVSHKDVLSSVEENSTAQRESSCSKSVMVCEKKRLSIKKRRRAKPNSAPIATLHEKARRKTYNIPPSATSGSQTVFRMDSVDSSKIPIASHEHNVLTNMKVSHPIQTVSSDENATHGFSTSHSSDGAHPKPRLEQGHKPLETTSDNSKINDISHSDSTANNTRTLALNDQEREQTLEPYDATLNASGTTPPNEDWQTLGSDEARFKINREEMGKKIMSGNRRKRSGGCFKTKLKARLKAGVHKNCRVEVTIEIHPRLRDEDKSLTLMANVKLINFNPLPNDEMIIVLSVSFSQLNGDEISRIPPHKSKIKSGDKERKCSLPNVLTHDKIFNGFPNKEYWCSVEAQIKVNGHPDFVMIVPQSTP